MTPVTAARIFVFTLTTYCVLAIDDTSPPFDPSTHIIGQWTVASVANASLAKDEIILEARENARALRSVLNSMGLERPLKAVRQRVISRVTSFRSFATAQWARSTTYAEKPSGRC
jgi:hypothetical protein